MTSSSSGTDMIVDDVDESRDDAAAEPPERPRFAASLEGDGAFVLAASASAHPENAVNDARRGLLCGVAVGDRTRSVDRRRAARGGDADALYAAMRSSSSESAIIARSAAAAALGDSAVPGVWSRRRPGDCGLVAGAAAAAAGPGDSASGGGGGGNGGQSRHAAGASAHTSLKQPPIPLRRCSV